MASLLKLKFGQLVALGRMKKLEQEVINTLNMAGTLTTQRSNTDLIKYCKLTIPAYFGFEGAAILLRDVKNELFFTINEYTQDFMKILNNRIYNGREDSNEIAPELRRVVKISFPSN